MDGVRNPFRPFQNFTPSTLHEGQTEVVVKPKATTFNFVGQKKTESIFTRYLPKTSDGLFQNKENIKIIKKWISDKISGTTTYPFLLLVGTTGVGKTELLKLCFHECGSSVVEYDEEIRSSTFETLMYNVINKNINNLFASTSGSNGTESIIIDNYQTTLLSTNRKELVNVLKTKKTCPVAFISSTYTNITDLIRSKGLVVYFENPTRQDLIDLTQRAFQGERGIEPTEYELNDIVQSSSGDIRSLLGMVDLTKTSEAKTVSSQEDFNKLKKDLEMDVQDTFSYLVSRDESFKDKIRRTSLYTSHLTQENYIDIAIKNQRDSDLHAISESADMCSFGIEVKQFMFKTQSWDEVNDIGNTVATLGPLHLVSLENKLPTIKVPNRRVNTLPDNCLYCGYKISDLSYVFLNIYAKPKLVDTEGVDYFLKLFDFIESNNMDFDTSFKIINNSYQLHKLPSKDIKRITGKIKKQYQQFIQNKND